MLVGRGFGPQLIPRIPAQNVNMFVHTSKITVPLHSLFNFVSTYSFLRDRGLEVVSKMSMVFLSNQDFCGSS
jgi:hypothetical protein